MPPVGLRKFSQQDFAAGMVRAAARHLIPDNGVYDALNLLTDDDGSLYKRAGSEYLSVAGAVSGTGLTNVYDVNLAVGQRTVFSNTTTFYVLDTDDLTPISLGVSPASGILPSNPLGHTVMYGALYLDDPSGNNKSTFYGGSRKTADWTGITNVVTTKGSATATRAAGGFTANVDAGMILENVGGGQGIVKSVDSDTSLTLTRGWTGSTATATMGFYRLRVVAPVPLVGLGGKSFVNSVSNRLVLSAGRKVAFSAIKDTATFAATDFHEFNTDVVGLGVVRDTLLVFTLNGVWAVSGLAFGLTDAVGNPQQRVERVSSDLVLWDRRGLAAWNNTLIAPCTDGVYLMDSVSEPQLLSRSITPTIAGYVRDGYQLGRASVYRNHYFLPVLDSAGAWADTLVCRLNRSVSTRVGVAFPWTRFDGSGAKAKSFALRIGSVTRSPLLLGAMASTVRLLKMSYMDPTATRKNDHDATTITWQTTTRDYATGNGNANLVRRMQLWYELQDAASDNPTISGAFTNGNLSTTTSLWGAGLWGTVTWADSSFVAFAGEAPEDDGTHPFTWNLSSPNARGRRIRFQVASADPASSAVLRGLSVWVRPSNKDN